MSVIRPVYYLTVLMSFLCTSCTVNIENLINYNPRVIPVDNSIVRMAQGATVVNGNLWIAYDDYKGNTSFQIIDISTGDVKRVITHTLSHCNSLDYNSEYDALLLPYDEPNNRCIIIYPAISSVESEMKIEDSIIIPLGETIGSLCWGEDRSTIFQILMWDDNINANKNLIRKIRLGIDQNGHYDKTLSIVKEYMGSITEGVDTSGPRSIYYAQGCDYDGSYLYLGYGTSGHNFLVLSLDEIESKYRVIGNYYWNFWGNNKEELFLEPEFVALNDDKIILGSRNYNDHLSAVLVFDVVKKWI